MLFRQEPTRSSSSAACKPRLRTQAPGWQWVQFVSTVSVVGDGNFVLALNVPAGTTDFWGIVAQHIPVALAPYDLYEYAGTLKHAPYYLAAGQTGTMEGGKLIAHGGLGIDTSVPKVAGAGSGQLTVGSIVTYEPRYAADGVTIIGWAPLFAATVNP